MSPSISGRENQLLEEIKSREMLFFKHRDVKRFLDIEDQAAYNLLSRMNSKGLVDRVEAGKYAIKDILNSRDVYELSSNLVDASYLGFLSALHFHNLTNQVPQQVQIVTTKRKSNIKLQGRRINFVTVKKDHYFGYQRYGNIIASDPEKTVIDCLRLPKKSGDISNILEIDYNELNISLLEKYCEKTGSSALASRLGLILDRKNIGFNENKIKDLTSHYSKLDPQKVEENPVKKWKIYANREIS